MVELSICIVNDGNRQLLSSCLESIYAYTSGVTFEVLVVDNDSRDDSVAFVRQAFPEVTVISSPVRQGYTLNMNMALRAATGQYVVLLNDDTRLTSNAFGAMTAFMRSNPAFGAVGPKLLNADGSFQIGPRGPATPWSLSVCELYLDWLFPRSRTFAAFSMKYWNPDQSGEMETASGACVLVRREVFEQVGLLEERIPIGPDDVELSLRMRAAGWKLYYLADTSVFHYGSTSRRRLPHDGVVPYYEGHFWMVRHHFGPLAVTLHRPCVVVGAMLRIACCLPCLVVPRVRARMLQRITKGWQVLRLVAAGREPAPRV